MIDKDDIKSDKPAETEPSTVKKTVKKKRAEAIGGRISDQTIPLLLENLQTVFDKIHNDNTVRDLSHDKLARQFTENMQQAFLEMRKQTEDREHLLEARLESIDRMNANQLQRVKWLSIPVTLMSVIAVVYLLYVVRIMETSMSSISGDMHTMTTYIETVQTDTGALSANTASMSRHIGSMNTQMGMLTGNVNNMMVDVHQLSRSVSPAMQGMSRFMP